MYDVFISHASEDKANFVRPLATELQRLGVSVWYDEFTLTPGKSLRRAIDEGLLRANFCVVVLSKAFFLKNWTQWELDGIVQRDVRSPSPVIIPIWLDVNDVDVAAVSPALCDIFAILAVDGVVSAARRIYELVLPSRAAGSNAEIGPRDALRSAARAAYELVKLLIPSIVRISLLLPDGERLRFRFRYMKPGPWITFGEHLDPKGSVAGFAYLHGNGTRSTL